MIEQPRGSDISQIPDQSGSYNIHNVEDVVVFLSTYKSLQASKDEAVVVVSVCRSLAPGCQTALKKSENGFRKKSLSTESAERSKKNSPPPLLI